MTALSPANVERLTERINLACKNPDTDLPGVSVAVIGKDGNQLFAHAAGQRGHGSSEAMKTDNVFWIASCTKMIVGMACMQLVERLLISLDDSDAVERYCPELKEVKVLQPDGQLVEKKRGITLRMLLTHTGMSLVPLAGSIGRTIMNGQANLEILNSRFWIFIHQSISARS